MLVGLVFSMVYSFCGGCTFGGWVYSKIYKNTRIMAQKYTFLENRPNWVGVKLVKPPNHITNWKIL